MKKLVLFAAIALGMSSAAFASEKGNKPVSSYQSERIQISEKIQIQEVQLKIDNQLPGTAHLYASPVESNNWLFIYHDKWGVTHNTQQEVYTLWKDLGNVNVLVVDLHDGYQPKLNSQALRNLERNDIDRDKAIIQSAIDFAGKDAKIGSLGWSMGGSWSIQSAIMANGQDVACVVYYGFPEMNTRKLEKLNTDVLAVYGSKDTYITPTVAQSFKNRMDVAGKTVIELTYENQGNFACRNSEKYNYHLASDAYIQVLDYLQNKFN